MAANKKNPSNSGGNVGEKDDNESNQPSSSSYSSSSSSFVNGGRIKLNDENKSQILQIVGGTRSDGIRQTINVRRNEEELMSEARESIAESLGDMTNVDVVTESIDVQLVDGVAQVKATVYCERIAPHRTKTDAFRRTSVTITRITEIDMKANRDRSRIYDRIVDGYAAARRTTADDDGDGSELALTTGRGRMSVADIYGLYRVFMEMVDASSSSDADDATSQNRNQDNGKRLANLPHDRRRFKEFGVFDDLDNRMRQLMSGTGSTFETNRKK